MAVPQRKESKAPRGGGSEGRITPDIVKAAKKNHAWGVQEALSKDPSCLNDVDSFSGMTALHWACANRNSEIFDILLDRPGISLQPLNRAGKLPSELALESGALKLAERLHELIHYHDHLPEDPFDEANNIERLDPKDS